MKSWILVFFSVLVLACSSDKTVEPKPDINQQQDVTTSHDNAVDSSKETTDVVSVQDTHKPDSVHNGDAHPVDTRTDIPDSGQDQAVDTGHDQQSPDTADVTGDTGHIQPTTWSKLINFGGEDYGFKVLAVKDGYLVAGSTDGGGGLTPGMLLLKLDQYGSVLWVMGYGDSKNDSLKAIAGAKDGGFFLAGYYYPKDRKDSDMVVLKVDATGNEKWRKLINYKEDDEAWGVLGLDDGGCIVVGQSFEPANNTNYARVVRLDADGNIVWNKQFGGDKNDYARAVVRGWDGGFVVLGYTASFGEGQHDMWVFRLKDNGDADWASTIGGPPEDFGYALIKTNDHQYAAVGATASYASQPERDVWLVKINTTGDKVWDQHYGFPAGDLGRGPNEYGYDLVQTVDGGFAIAGALADPDNGSMDGLMIRTDDKGNTTWMYRYDVGGKDGLYGIVNAPDHGFVAVGYARFDESRAEDLWVEKVTPDGTGDHRVKK